MNNAIGLNLTQAFWILTPFDARDKYVDPTILFMRMIAVARQNAVAPAGGAAIAFGVIPFTYDPDLVTVPTEYPEPYGDPEADWMITQVFPVPESTPSATEWNTLGADRLLHSSAKRKLGNSMGLLFVVESFAIGWSYAVNIRYLLQE